MNVAGELIVKTTTNNADNSGSASMTAVRRDARTSAPADNAAQDSLSSSSTAAAAAMETLETEDATVEMDEGQCYWTFLHI